MQPKFHHAVPGRTPSAWLAGTARTGLLLVGAAILPLLPFGGWLGYFAAVQTRAQASRGAVAAVDGAASLSDRGGALIAGGSSLAIAQTTSPALHQPRRRQVLQ